MIGQSTEKYITIPFFKIIWGIRKRFFCSEFKKNASVLFGFPNSLNTVERIELVALFAFNENWWWNKKKFLCWRMCKVGLECAPTWKTNKLLFYERLLSSRDKKAVSEEVQKLEPRPEYERIIRDPYVLEFLDLEENPHFYEKELEQALIDHLQKFLLELGRGFSFVARQKHITFDDRHFYIYLVFYNYILKCLVLIDLKIGDLSHQDLGQMQMYVNYYTREMMNDGDNPPIGIVLCADKSDAVVKYTLSEDNKQIYASKYKLYMPTEEELKKELNLEDFKKMS